ncbi:MAG: vanadium-dependent haloperoxidase [Propionicimonas sp.]|nr:vanadium-dependent haloperoxidase [Propionicimonas sp.]
MLSLASRRLVGGVVAGGLLAGLLPAPAAEAAAPRPSTVLRWSAIAGQTALAACISPANDALHESRMYAMTSLAVHNALNAIEPRYRSYGDPLVRTRGASAPAAVAAAARTVLVATVTELPEMFADCRASALKVVEDAYAAELGALPSGAATERGVGVGSAAGRAILRLRAGDGSDTPLLVPDYPQGTAPGQWRFTPDRPFAAGPGWGEVTPFGLRGRAAFHIEPAYRLTSRAYASDFAEVKALGGDGVTTPSTRTADQTEAARFWLESSPLQWNRIARGAAVTRGLGEWESARLMALLNMALADGYVASLAVKYAHPFWRPVTAIREAAGDGNPSTRPDATWTPLDVTPPIPDHDSAHAVEGAAAATVLARVLGTDGVRFRACSLTLPEGQRCDDPTPRRRSFTGFWQAARENADSRVWVGFHFRHAAEVGLDHGRLVASQVLRTLPPAPGGAGGVRAGWSRAPLKI